LGSLLLSFILLSSIWKRDRRNGVTPPLWEKIQRMPG